MILSDSEIKKRLESKNIWFEPQFWNYNVLEQIWPASLDFRLGNIFKVYRRSRKTCIDVREWVDLDHVETIKLNDGDSFVLHPGDFVIAGSLEYLTIPYDLACRCEWRSSLWRLWLILHSTAWFIDPGWKWIITLEMTNINVLPIKLYVGMKIGQYAFEKVEWKVEVPYDVRPSTKYVWETEPEVSRAKWDN